MKRNRLIYIYIYIYIYSNNSYHCVHGRCNGWLTRQANLYKWVRMPHAYYLVPQQSKNLSKLASNYKSRSVSLYDVHTIIFQTFFVQVFKIVVDSWKFSILLLYILWDEWLIFMISASNQRLQQELEYTLLNPDCHRSGISKLQSDTWEERYAIKLCFKLEKNATETYGMLQTAFGSSFMKRASVFEWHNRFKEGRESVRDDERCGKSKEVNRPQLIGQRVRVRVTMLRFEGSSGRDS